MGWFWLVFVVFLLAMAVLSGLVIRFSLRQGRRR